MAENRIYRFFEIITGLFFTGVLLVALVIDNRWFYIYQNFSVIPNLIFFIIALAIFLRIKTKVRTEKSIIIKREPQTAVTVRRIRYTLLALTAVLFAVEILVTWNIFFKTGWDCSILVKAAQDYAHYSIPIGDSDYFSMYTNNVFLVGIFSGIIKLVNACGIADDYFVLVIVGALLVSFSGFFMADLIRTLTCNRKLVYIFWVIFALLTGLSPWVSVPYSDTYSIIFPTLVVWLYVTKKERPLIVSWFLIGLMAFVGYFIKPTTLLSLMVIVFISIIHFFATVKTASFKSNMKRIIFFLAGLGLAVVVSFAADNAIKNKLGFTPKPEKQFTPIHYFMMGMNVESGGGYNQWDVNFSASAPDVSSRNSEDFKVAVNRIKDMGPKRFIAFMCQKALTNYNDGSFAWGNEGEFYWYLQDRNSVFARLLRAWYYEDGFLYKWFIAFTQGIWFVCLCAMTLSLVAVKHTTDYRYTTVRLCVLAISLFLLVFEARARYLFLYSPLIYTAEAIGIQTLIERIKTGKR